MHARVGLLVGGSLLGSLLATCAPGEPSAGKPPGNVLLVVLDDVGVDGLGCYGEGRDLPVTPTIDGLAARGVLFRNVWAPPLCMPARVAIQTGRHGFRTGVGEIAPPGMPLEELTLPEMLEVGADASFAHAAIGKWHMGSQFVGGPDAARVAGFDTFIGTAGNAGDYYEYRRVVDGETREHEGYLTTVQVDDALGWIGSATEPWFCYLALQAAHEPFQLPPAELHTRPPRSFDARADPDRFAYRATVEALDHELGRLLEELGADTLARTHVLVVGDDGTPARATHPPFQRGQAKGTLFEGGLGVPLVVASPRVTSPGREVDALVHVADLFLTVADLCRADLERVRAAAAGPLDSVSLLAYLEDPAAEPQREILYTEKFDPNGPGPWNRWFQVARDERFKLVRRRTARGQQEEMFDLARDPFERVDLLQVGLPPRAERSYESLARHLDELAGQAAHPLRDTSR